MDEEESGGATDAGTYRAAPSCCPALSPPLRPAGEQRDPPRSQPLRPSMLLMLPPPPRSPRPPPITPPSATQHPAHSPAPRPPIPAPPIAPPRALRPALSDERPPGSCSLAEAAPRLGRTGEPKAQACSGYLRHR